MDRTDTVHNRTISPPSPRAVRPLDSISAGSVQMDEHVRRARLADQVTVLGYVADVYNDGDRTRLELNTRDGRITAETSPDTAMRGHDLYRIGRLVRLTGSLRRDHAGDYLAAVEIRNGISRPADRARIEASAAKLRGLLAGGAR